MVDLGLMGVRLALLFHIGCVILSHPNLYAKLKHIRVFRIMGKIGGAEDFPNVRKNRKG